jgi:hypothetical protein
MRRTLVSFAVLSGLFFANVPADAEGRWRPPPVVQAPRPSLELVADSGATLPNFPLADRRFVLGAPGERYRIRIVNPTGGRVEAVVSVDGLDAIDGKPAGTGKRGYLIPAHGSVVIDGWRTSLDTVAAFRFAAVPESYAAMTGHDQNIGVIGVAFFREQPPPPPRPPIAWRGMPVPSAKSHAGGGGGADLGSSAEGAGAPAARPGLGTQFGESHESHVEEVEFRRADATPMTVAMLRYDDRDGLVARGIRLPPRDERDMENDRRDRAQPFADTRFAQPPR